MTSVPTNPSLLPSSAPSVAPTAGAPAQGLGPSDPTRETATLEGGDPAINAIASGDHSYEGGVQGQGHGVPAIVRWLGTA